MSDKYSWADICEEHGKRVQKYKVIDIKQIKKYKKLIAKENDKGNNSMENGAESRVQG